mmetsp:Transcript_77735/g.222810  ORF Transcript_77735/g.222810 Transcript_77735/m.222810 type:complete len:275 (-) Transcript_77735:61-885(-)
MSSNGSTPELRHLPEAPTDAVEQSDGSFVQELEDGSSLRWTKRPDGAWRKPEHRRANYEEGDAGAEASTSGAAASEGASKKHPLQRTWCLYVGPRTADNGTSWSEKHNCVSEFTTVEDFWCYYNHSHLPSSVDNVDYLLFKKEADEGATSYYRGGRWVLSLEQVDCFDSAWLGSILSIIGESFEDCGGEEVVHGVGLSVNRHGAGATVELWISEPTDEDQVLAIGRHYQAAVADFPGMWDKAGQVLQFEDFAKRKVVVKLAGQKATKSTAGIFQ